MKKIVLLIFSTLLVLYSCKKSEPQKEQEEFDDKITISDIEKILEDHRQKNKGNDSIRKTLDINDIITIKSFHPVWKDTEGKYDTKISILHEIIRIGNDERRTVDAINYDMIITDRFENELYRIKNLTYDENLVAHDIGVNYSLSDFPSTILEYNKNNNTILEKLRTYHWKQLKTKAEIKVILYTDGKVLKAN